MSCQARRRGRGESEPIPPGGQKREKKFPSSGNSDVWVATQEFQESPPNSTH